MLVPRVREIRKRPNVLTVLWRARVHFRRATKCSNDVQRDIGSSASATGQLDFRVSVIIVLNSATVVAFERPYDFRKFFFSLLLLRVQPVGPRALHEKTAEKKPQSFALYVYKN